MPLGPIVLFNELTPNDKVHIMLAHLVQNCAKLHTVNTVTPEEWQHHLLFHVKDVLTTFEHQTSNLNTLNQISWNLFENYNYPLLIQQKLPDVFAKNFKAAKQLLIDNPNYIFNQKALQDLIEETDRVHSYKDQHFFVEKQNAVQSLQDEKIKLPKIPSLILLSAYLACRNPEKTD